MHTQFYPVSRFTDLQREFLNQSILTILTLVRVTRIPAIYTFTWSVLFPFVVLCFNLLPIWRAKGHSFLFLTFGLLPSAKYLHRVSIHFLFPLK